jgi:hypothetical protein
VRLLNRFRGLPLPLLVAGFALLATTPGYAQRGARGGAAPAAGTPPAAQAQGGRGAPAAGARANAPIDLTGNWVSVIAEDWEFRMVTPNKGIFDTLTLNNEGRRVGNAWDPAKDEAAGEQCRAYGAANIMRIPTRLRVSWDNDTTLKVETDAGTQTRLFHFGGTPPANAEPSWQGYSVAEWESVGGGRGGGRGGAARSGNLKVVTTHLRPGYVRKNGAPYSDRAVVTEYFDLYTLPNGDTWFTVTTKVDDPVYFSRPLVTTSDFKKLPDASGWNPTPCSAR